jgi:neopullulanase
MRVVLDGVFNHTGRGFFPFHHVMETGPSSPYRHWFHIDDARLEAGRPLLAYPPPGTPSSEFGYKAWWGLPALPKLNTSHPEVHEFLMTVAEHWLRFGIDGWRLDVPGEIDDEPFWQEFRRRCKAVRPDAYLCRRDLARRTRVAAGRPFRRADELPTGEAILGFAGMDDLDMAIVSTHHEYRLWVRPLDGPAFAGRVMELASAYDPDVVAVQLNVLGSHDAPRLRTVLGATREAPSWPCSSRRRSPARHRSTTATRSAWRAATIPIAGAGSRGTSRWAPGLRESVRALLLRRAERGLRDGSIRIAGAAARESPSSAATGRRVSSWQ